jgi:1-aminocyclopropane-1-carboxylate deaminase
MTLQELPLNLPSPVQELIWKPALQSGICLLVKRDDLIHPWISGNKWRKLKYNIKHVLGHNIPGIVTFGGAYSNHIHATAGAANLMGIRSVGIIRGDGYDPENHTLRFCREKGMELHFVNRTDYREKDQSAPILDIIMQYQDYYLIPEGGTNELAVRGAMEIFTEYLGQGGVTPDFVVLAGGTGGTAAGVLKSLPSKSKLIVFAALKSDHLISEILKMAGAQRAHQLIYKSDNTFGGYAKWNKELLLFTDHFESETGVPVDPVYNAKVMFGLESMIKNYEIPQGSVVLWIHTGGIQGKASHPEA